MKYEFHNIVIYDDIIKWTRVTCAEVEGVDEIDAMMNLTQQFPHCSIGFMHQIKKEECNMISCDLQNPYPHFGFVYNYPTYTVPQGTLTNNTGTYYHYQLTNSLTGPLSVSTGGTGYTVSTGP